MAAVLSNQNSDICVSTRPLSGMSVGMITSYAEMRSEATIRRSPSTSYISRTLPVEWRVRSASAPVATRRDANNDTSDGTSQFLGLKPLTDTPGGERRRIEGDRTRHPPLEGRSPEDSDRGQLLLHRAGGDPPRSTAAGGGNRVVPRPSGARTDRAHESPPLPPQRPLPGRVRLSSALQRERAPRVRGRAGRRGLRVRGDAGRWDYRPGGRGNLPRGDGASHRARRRLPGHRRRRDELRRTPIRSGQPAGRRSGGGQAGPSRV